METVINNQKQADKVQALSLGGEVFLTEAQFSGALKNLNWGVEVSPGAGFIKNSLLAPFEKYSEEAKDALSKSPLATILPELDSRKDELKKIINDQRSLGLNKATAQKLLTELETKLKLEDNLRSGVVKVTKASDNIKDFGARLSQALPNAQHIDLSVLATLTREDGLPRLACFDPALSGRSNYVVTRMSSRSSESCASLRGAITQCDWENRDFDKLLGDSPIQGSIMKSVAQVVQASTGVIVAGDAANATDITIQTHYLGPVIPNKIEKLIKDSRDLFDKVLLLAEVSRWEVIYTDLKRGVEPKIKGSQIYQEKQDPLVIGFKMLPKFCGTDQQGKVVIGEEYVPFLIGAFDESQLERWVRMEMTERA